MHRLIRILLFISLLLIALLLVGWSIRSLTFTHDYIKKTIEHKLSVETDSTVTIDSIDGFLPFSIHLNEVTIFKKDSDVKIAKIENFSCIPAWFDILLGKIAFFKVDIARFELFDNDGGESVSASLSSFLPSKRISLYSYNIREIALSNSTFEKLKSTKLQEVISKNWELKGDFFYNPKAMSLNSQLLLSPLDNLENAPISIYLLANKKRVAGSIDLTTNLNNSHIKKAYLHLDLASRNSLVIRKIWESTFPFEDDELFNGDFRLQGVSLSENIEHPEIFAEGKLRYFTNKVLSFTTSHLKICHLPFIECKTNLSNCEHRNFKPSISLISELSGNVTFAYEDFSKGLNLEIIDSKFNVSDRIVSAVKGNVILQKENNLWSANISSSLSLMKANSPSHLIVPIDLSCSVSEKENFFKLDSISIKSPTFEVGGALKIKSPSSILGSIKGAVSDISPLAGVLSYNLAGEGNFECQFNEDRSSVAISLEKIHSSAFYAEKGLFEIKSTGPYFNLNLDVVAQIQNIRWSHLQFNELKLNATSTNRDGKFYSPFEFQGQGSSNKGPFSLMLKGNCEKDNDIYTFEASDFTASIEKKTLILQYPLLFKYKRGNLELFPFEIREGNSGLFEGSLIATKDGLSGNFTAKNLPFELLNFVAPNNPLAGTLSCEGFLFGTTQTPRLHLELTSNALIWNGPHHDLFSPFETCIQADIGNGRMLASGEVKNSGSPTPLVWEFSIPIKLTTVAPLLSIPENEPISGSIKGDTEITPLLAHSLQENEVIEGIVSCNLFLSGTYKKPDLSGSLSLKKGKIDILKTGGILTDIQMASIIKNNELFASKLTATDGKGGFVSAYGTMKLNKAENFPFSLILHPKNMEIIRKDFASASVTGEGTFSGTLKEATIKGDVTCDNVLLNLMSDFSSNLPSIDFTYLNGPYAKQDKSKQGFSLFLDVRAHIPNTGKITGRGLKSRWKGDLKIKGSASDLKVLGEINSTKGTFTLADKEFKLTSGSVDCSGNIFTESRVNANATFDNPQLQTELFLRGSVQSLRISVRSNPPLPEREILSRLLFNKPFSDISPFESLQVAQALLSVHKSADRFDLIQRIKKRLYIDQIEVNRTLGSGIDDQDSLSFSIGKYLSKRFLFRVSKDVVSDVNRVGIEANLIKRLSLSCQIGDDSERQVLLLWKHDY